MDVQSPNCRIIKQTLFKVLGKACLSFEELETLLWDCEALTTHICLRRRPRFGSLNTKDVSSRYSIDWCSTFGRH